MTNRAQAKVVVVDAAAVDDDVNAADADADDDLGQVGFVLSASLAVCCWLWARDNEEKWSQLNWC